VYFYKTGFVPRDIESFEPLVRIWSRDSKAYYWGTREISGADRLSFRISEQEPWFAFDHNHLFWQGWPIEGCNPETFHIQTAASGHDSLFRYQFEEVSDNNPNIAFRKIKVRKQPLN
jgi:hypothetical protein